MNCRDILGNLAKTLQFITCSSSALVHVEETKPKKKKKKKKETKNASTATLPKQIK
jgi:hypothetical protein